MCKTDAKMQMGQCHNTLSLIKYQKKLTSFSSRASLFMDYPRNMFYVVQDLQMKRNMVFLLFCLRFGQITNLPKCVYIFSCRDQCMSEKHRILEQACLQRISSRYSSRRNNGGDPFLLMT
ncbi:unnamed protein product [Brassica rapa subsp. narinosa]